jgi:isovaleryl-CoA dehydrogenase
MADTATVAQSSAATSIQFELTAEQRAVLEAADRYAREELYPLARRMDEEEWWPADAFAALGEQGYLGITVPQSYGGAGLDLLSAGLVTQAFSRWNHAFGLSWLAHANLCTHNLYRHANEAQRQRYLPGLCSGKLLGALALTEPGAGSDAIGSMRTSARREGDYYLLNGTKMFITNGPVADVLLTYAKTASA